MVLPAGIEPAWSPYEGGASPLGQDSIEGSAGACAQDALRPADRRRPANLKRITMSKSRYPLPGISGRGGRSARHGVVGERAEALALADTALDVEAVVTQTAGARRSGERAQPQDSAQCE